MSTAEQVVSTFRAVQIAIEALDKSINTHALALGAITERLDLHEEWIAAVDSKQWPLTRVTGAHSVKA